MKNVTSKPEPSHPAIESNSHLFDDWFDPIENMIRGQVRGLIEEMIRGELDATLSRPRYGRLAGHSEGRDTTTARSPASASATRSAPPSAGGCGLEAWCPSVT
jgi:putative transposase